MVRGRVDVFGITICFNLYLKKWQTTWKKLLSNLWEFVSHKLQINFPPLSAPSYNVTEYSIPEDGILELKFDPPATGIADVLGIEATYKDLVSGIKDKDKRNEYASSPERAIGSDWRQFDYIDNNNSYRQLASPVLFLSPM